MVSNEWAIVPDDYMKNTQENWSLFCDGDNAALGVLYDELITPLQYTAYHYTRDWKQAEDIAGDVFLMLVESALDQRKSWSSKNGCLAFLKVVIQYKSIDWVRKQSNHHRIHQKIDWPILVHPQLSDDQLKNYAFSLLNEKEQQLLQSMIEGKSVSDISQENQVSEKTLRNNISIIRLKLNRIKFFVPFLFH